VRAMICHVRITLQFRNPILYLTGNHSKCVRGFLLTSTMQRVNILAAQILSSHSNTNGSKCLVRLKVHSTKIGVIAHFFRLAFLLIQVI